MKITELIDFKTFTYNWDKIEQIAEFKKLKKCEQNPKWHAEGNAWKHTKLVCNEAVKICKERKWENEYGYVSLLLTSALFHDIGKGVTTHQGKDGRWHAYEHEFEGEKITRYLLWDEGFFFREAVCSLVRNHMTPLQFYDSKDFYGKIIEMSKLLNFEASLNLLFLLKKCDILGSMQEDEVSKKSDLIKIESLINIANHMSCLYEAFPVYYRNEHKDYVDSVNKKDAKVYVMIGIPGSGKSTYAKELAKSNDFVIVSRDTIRAELGFCKEGEKVVLNKHNEEIVTENFNEKVLEAVKCGKTVIIDNLNTKKKYRNGYKTLLSNYNVDWFYCYIEAPSLIESMTRRDGQISRETFKQMIMDFEFPTAYEYNSFNGVVSGK